MKLTFTEFQASQLPKDRFKTPSPRVEGQPPDDDDGDDQSGPSICCCCLCGIQTWDERSISRRIISRARGRDKEDSQVKLMTLRAEAQLD